MTKVSRNSPKVWKLSNTPVKNLQAKVEIAPEVKKYFELRNNDMAYQNAEDIIRGNDE